MQSENKIARRARKARSVSSFQRGNARLQPETRYRRLQPPPRADSLRKALKNMQVYLIARKKISNCVRSLRRLVSLYPCSLTTIQLCSCIQSYPRRVHDKVTCVAFSGSTPRIPRDYQPRCYTSLDHKRKEAHVRRGR